MPFGSGVCPSEWAFAFRSVSLPSNIFPPGAGIFLPRKTVKKNYIGHLLLTVNEFYKSLFNAKTYKLSLSSGCTCPTRDGTKGVGGCIFCSATGSGDFTPSTKLDIQNQIVAAKELLAPKLKHSDKIKYIPYFQSFTSTYGDLEKLQVQWEEALTCPDVVGLAIATRPDCLSDSCLEVLGKLAERTFLQIELGLQTSNNKTADYIHRGFETQVYEDAVARIRQANPKIHIVTHLIFGLPGENKDDMMNSVREVVKTASDGIKITCLYVLKNTELAKDFEAGKFKPLEMQEYFDLVSQALKIIPQSMVIHRLTGDPPKSEIIEPRWTMNKKLVINRVREVMEASENCRSC